MTSKLVNAGQFLVCLILSPLALVVLLIGIPIMMLLGWDDVLWE